MDMATNVKFVDTKYTLTGFNPSTKVSPNNPTTTIKYIAPRVITPNLANSFQGPFRGVAWSKVGSNIPTTATSTDHGLATLVHGSKFSTIPAIHSIDGERIIDEHRELSKLTEILCDAILRCCTLEAHNHAQELQIEWLDKNIHHNRVTIEKLFLTEMDSAKQLKKDTLQHKTKLETKLNTADEKTNTCEEKYKQILTKRNAFSKQLFDFERDIAQNNVESQFLQRRIHNLEDESNFYTLKNQNLHARKNRLCYELDEEKFSHQVLKSELEILEGEKITNEDIHSITLHDVRNVIDISQIAGVQPSKYYSSQLNQEVQRMRNEYEQKIEVYREELHRQFELELYRYQIHKTRPVPKVTQEHQTKLEEHQFNKKDILKQIAAIRGSSNEIINQIEIIEKQIRTVNNDQQSVFNRQRNLAMFNQLIQERERQFGEVLRTRKTLKEKVENYRERLNRHAKQTVRNDSNKRSTIHESHLSLIPPRSSIQNSLFRLSLQDLSSDKNKQEQLSQTHAPPPTIIRSTSPVQRSKYSSIIKLTDEFQDRNTLTNRRDVNIDQDCKELHRLLNDSNIDELAIIRIFCNRITHQRLKIRDRYNHLYNRNLSDDFEKILSGSLSKFLRVLLLSSIEYDCFELRRILKRPTIDENILVEILFSRSNKHIQSVKNTYKHLFHTTIEQDITDHETLSTKKIYLTILQSNRPDDNNVNDNEILKDSRDLYETGAKWHVDGSTFIQLLCSRSNLQLKHIFAAYQKFSNIDIEQTIRLRIEGSLYHTLMSIVRIIRNQARFFAYGLRKSLKGIATNEDDLNRIIVTQCEIDMVQIKTEYDRIATHSLVEHIRMNVGGYYKRALLELLRQHVQFNDRDSILQDSNKSEEIFRNENSDQSTVQWREPSNRFYSDTFIKRSILRSTSDQTIDYTKENYDRQPVRDTLNSRFDRNNQGKNNTLSTSNSRILRTPNTDRHSYTLTTLYLQWNQIGDVEAQHLVDAIRYNKTLITINLSCNRIGPIGAQYLADALQHSTTLTTLDLRKNQIEDVGAQHLANGLRHNTTLTTLRLDSNQIGPVGAQHLANGLRHNITLTMLYLGSNQIGDVGAQYLGDVLQHNTTLITINLSCNQIGPVGAQYLDDGLRCNTILTTLDLHYNQIGDVGAQHLADALQHNTALTELLLVRNRIGDVGAQHLADGLRNNTTLVTLYLSFNEIGDVGAQYLADGLRNNTALTTLFLRKNRIGDVGAQHLGDILQHNTTLITINLSCNQIGPVGAQYLADGLRRNTILTTLDLFSNEIKEVGAQHLADALQHNTTLTTLDIRCNGIRDVGAQHLANALQHNRTLVKLYLDDNGIGAEINDIISEFLERNRCGGQL
ncbi:unnamed protein product [Adineta steineri]|uniref:Uncharacterized protein n=1 Tax=Adineta steineri TaxID=433720 RepID=A0A814CX44_9BILA|nr:unnamed protein product [Adineta steineri]